MNINKLHLTNLRNDGHFQLHTQVKALVELEGAAPYSDFVRRLNEFVDVHNRSLATPKRRGSAGEEGDKIES